MESAVRYDFSFPPKSNSNSLHQQQTTGANSSCGALSNNLSSHGHMNHAHSHTIYTRHNSNSGHYYAGAGNGPHHGHPQQHNGHSSAAHQPANGYHVNLNVNNPVGLSKSASTSLLSCVTNLNNNNNNNNNNTKSVNGNYCNSCNKECNSSNNFNHNHKGNTNRQPKNNNNPNHQYSIMTSNQQSNMQQSSHVSTSIGAPVTPKDGNCSFTFDDLKNTLSFMDDSPLINTNSNNNNNNTSAINNPTTSVLMVIPTAQPADCTSSHSASSSSSASSGGLSSGSSCNSYCATGSYLPKSNSNPMLLSNNSTLSSSSSTTGLSTSPVSSNFSITRQSQQGLIIKSECLCSSSQQQQQKYHHCVSDLGLKKSPSSTSSTGLNSLIQPANSLPSVTNNFIGINTAIETAAKKYRCAAQISEATCCWKGKLPPKQYKTPIVYSTKVFVGGLPWDITEEDLIKEFGVFGPCRVEWTNKEKFNLLSSGMQQSQTDSSYDGGSSSSNGHQSYRNNNNNNNRPGNKNSDNQNSSSKQRSSPGFAYVIYENEYSIRSLVSNCIEDYQNGRDRVEYYFKISTRRVRNKEVQIIPWILADNNFALCTPKELDPKKTVFVGNLHGTMTARDLAHIMNELFGCVVYAGIDIDKLKYPIGSGRVTFSHQQNFMRAVRAAFVDIQSPKFSKRIQIDPYLEDVQCFLCYSDKGIYFCRDFQCFNYYCGLCWDKQHSYNQLGNHKPLMRKREDK